MAYSACPYKTHQIAQDFGFFHIKGISSTVGIMVVAMGLVIGLASHSEAQGITSYDLYHLQGDDIYWQKTYSYSGGADSLRQQVVQMLKSKFFTTNVFRSSQGYNGELRHYQVDCKRYERAYMGTPRAYCEGEWTGKFTISIIDGSYEVTVYALYFEKTDPAVGHYGTKKTVKGRFVDTVTKRNRTMLKESEFHNLTLMSLSLGDNFDIQNTIIPAESKE